jgi:CheY-like chemotaxis protein
MADSLDFGRRPIVFVAEDDPDFRAALGDIFADAGLRAVLFPNAEQLLESLGRALPAVIVTDVAMPGLSGAELLGRLRRSERWRRIPIVVMTANNDTALPLRLDAPVVYKPDTDGLLGVIQTVLRRSLPTPPPVRLGSPSDPGAGAASRLPDGVRFPV